MRWIYFLLLSALVFPAFGSESGTTTVSPGSIAGAGGFKGFFYHRDTEKS